MRRRAAVREGSSGPFCCRSDPRSPTSDTIITPVCLYYKPPPTMINAVLVFNNAGQPRLTKFYTQLVRTTLSLFLPTFSPVY